MLKIQNEVLSIKKGLQKNQSINDTQYKSYNE